MLAYLTSQYPATSHTFIRREISGLRAAGTEIKTFSIRSAGPEELCTPEQRAEAESTFTVLTQPWRVFFLAHIIMLLSKPILYLRTLAMASRHRAPGMRNMFLALAHFAECVVLARELKRQRICHLHNHFGNSGATVGLLSSRFLSIPWSFTIHGVSETDYPAGLLLPAKISEANFVACASFFVMAQAMRMAPPNDWGKLHIVRCGLPLETLRPAPRTEAHRVDVITVGRLSPEKGLTGLLRAFAQVCGSHPEAHLTLVGEGPERAHLGQTVQDLGVEHAVTFAGRLSEEQTLAAIARSHILVVPSFMEGLPVVLTEAMAYGLPVIASRVAGIPELVREGENGLLFTPARWEELEERMRTLICDPAMRAQLGAAGKEAVAREFDIRISVKRLQHLFETCSP